MQATTKLKIKWLLLDADGVLINSYLPSSLAHQKLAAILGLRVPSLEEIKKVWGKHWSREFVPYFWPSDVERFCRAYLKKYPSLRYPPFPNLAETLQLIYKQGISLGVVTNRERGKFKARLAEAKILPDIFAFIQTASDTPFLKPDPRVFEPIWKILQGLNVRKTDVVYAGDTLADLEVTNKFGFHFIAVASGPCSKNDFIQAGVSPNLIINKPEMLTKVVTNSPN